MILLPQIQYITKQFNSNVKSHVKSNGFAVSLTILEWNHGLALTT